MVYWGWADVYVPDLCTGIMQMTETRAKCAKYHKSKHLLQYNIEVSQNTQDKHFAKITHFNTDEFFVQTTKYVTRYNMEKVTTDQIFLVTTWANLRYNGRGGSIPIVMRHIFCVAPMTAPQRVMPFLGTNAFAWHLSTLKFKMRTLKRHQISNLKCLRNIKRWHIYDSCKICYNILEFMVRHGMQRDTQIESKPLVKRE